MSKQYNVWFGNIIGCAIGISDISLVVTVTASSKEEAIALAVEKAWAVNQKSGMPPHGLRVRKATLTSMAMVCDDEPTR